MLDFFHQQFLSRTLLWKCSPNGCDHHEVSIWKDQRNDRDIYVHLCIYIHTHPPIYFQLNDKTWENHSWKLSFQSTKRKVDDLLGFSGCLSQHVICQVTAIKTGPCKIRTLFVVANSSGKDQKKDLETKLEPSGFSLLQQPCLHATPSGFLGTGPRKLAWP